MLLWSRKQTEIRNRAFWIRPSPMPTTTILSWIVQLKAHLSSISLTITPIPFYHFRACLSPSHSPRKPTISSPAISQWIIYSAQLHYQICKGNRVVACRTLHSWTILCHQWVIRPLSLLVLIRILTIVFTQHSFKTYRITPPPRPSSINKTTPSIPTPHLITASIIPSAITSISHLIWQQDKAMPTLSSQIILHASTVRPTISSWLHNLRLSPVCSATSLHLTNLIMARATPNQRTIRSGLSDVYVI